MTSPVATEPFKQAVAALDKAAAALQDAACLDNPLCVAKLIQGVNGLGTTETVPVADNLTGGKLVNPLPIQDNKTVLISPDQRGEQGARHTGNADGKPDTGGNTIGTPIPEGTNTDELAYLALKGKDAQAAAGKLGFDRRISPQKAPFNSHGQPVFSNGKNYITPDLDSHNVSNGWKLFNSKGKRIGSYDSALKRIKD